MSTEAKEKLEQSWVDHLMADVSEWAHCRSTHRVYLCEGSRVEITDDKGLVRATLRADDVALGADFGLSLRLGDALISSHPMRIAPSLYVWIPAFADVRWAPIDYSSPASPRRLTFPLCIKTATDPRKSRKSGAYYLTVRGAA